MYKFEIIETDKPDILSLHVYIFVSNTYGFALTDIIEGPSRFVINKLAQYYSDDLRLKKIR